MNVPQFVHFTVGGEFFFFQFGVMNIFRLELRSFCTFLLVEVAIISLGCIPRSGIARSKGRDIFSFGRSPQVDMPFYTPLAVYESAHCCRALSPFGIVRH